MSTKIEIEDTNDIVERDFHVKTGFRFAVLTASYHDDDTYETAIVDSDSDVIWKAVADGPSESRRKAIGYALEAWPKIQKDIDLAEKLEAQGRAELTATVEDED